jgi:2-keto-3-deoxy-L-rhamnonate aldolase RhmA
MARSGLDWLALDAEHGMFSMEDLRICLEPVQKLGIPAFVRAPANDPTWLKLILDLGPDGVIVPMVNSSAEAADAVASCLYPPRGRRGMGSGRLAGYGLDYVQYVEEANDDLAILVQIEHRDAVARVEEIAATPGITGLFIGPTDLSASMGLVGQREHPDVISVIERTIAAGRAAGVLVGMFCGSEDQVVGMHAQGVHLMAWTTELRWLADAASGSVQRLRTRTGDSA